MNDRSRKRYASYGLEVLKDSVLYLLYEVRDKKESLLQPKEIGERLDIRTPNSEREGHNSLILGILHHLWDRKYVAREWTTTYKWRITEEGVKFIEG